MGSLRGQGGQGEALGDDFRRAVEEHFPGNALKGIAIISSRDNLFLISADLGPESRRLLASIYVENDRSYWKVEDLNDSNREMLVLFAERDGVKTRLTSMQLIFSNERIK